MKIIKTTLLTGLFAFSALVSHAQLSDRQNNPGKFKIGTRPVEGNLGFMLGGSISDFKQMFGNDSANQANGDTVKNTLPLLAVKYYIKDDLVFRTGIKWHKTSMKRFGTINDTLLNYNLPFFPGDTLYYRTKVDTVRISSEFIIYPGIEKHFLNSNIFDAYVAVTLPLGLLREKAVDNVEWNSPYAGDEYRRSTMTKNSFVYGIEAFMGIQAFIADLPLAIGLEMGLSGLGYKGEKYKTVYSESFFGQTPVDQTYYTSDETGAFMYSNLKASSYEMKSSVRLSISYYFAK